MIFRFTICLLLITGFNSDTYAYLDGGSASLLLQLILGGVAGAGAILKIYWHRIKSFFSKKNEGDN